MNDFCSVAVVDSVEQLQEQTVSLALTETSLGLILPKVVEFASAQVLHNYTELLLLRKWEVVEKLHYVAVAQLRQGLDLFRNQL